MTKDDNKTLIQRLGRWTKHHSSAGEWEAYIDRKDRVWSRTATGT